MKTIRTSVLMAVAMLLAAACDKDDKMGVPAPVPTPTPTPQPITGTAPVSTEAGIEGNQVKWVQLWENGPKFAEMNVGADSAASYGDFFAWGETEPYYQQGDARKESPSWQAGKSSGYAWGSYRYCKGTEKTFTKYCNSVNSGNGGYSDKNTVLDFSDDAAYVCWGSNWRMPDANEMKALADTNYTDGGTWIEDYHESGVAGMLFKGKPGTRFENNAVFLPAEGYRTDKGLTNKDKGIYWTGSLRNETASAAWQVNFTSEKCNSGYFPRYSGLSVRPVLNQMISGTCSIRPEAGVTGHRAGWVQLWENGPRFALMNVGADSVAGYGDYFAFGETEPYYQPGNAQAESASWKSGKEAGYAWGSYPEPYPETDIANALWGENWRMPSSLEFDTLRNTDYTDGGTWIENYKGTGVNGYIFKGTAGTEYADNELFFPAASMRQGLYLNSLGGCGFYWSGTVRAQNDNYAYYMYFNRDYSETDYHDRCLGRAVRPVLK